MIDSRIALIHATPLAVGPVEEAFKALWPQAACMNLLDDSLGRDLAAAGQLTAGLAQRLVDLAAYAEATGAQGVLFTCSAFGPAIERAAALAGVPVLKPNQAMFDEALDTVAPLGRAGRVVLVTTFASATESMAQEFRAMAQARGLAIELNTVLVPGALAALQAGDQAHHDQAVRAALATLPACDVVMLGQFSMAHLQSASPQAAGRVVLSSPGSAVKCLRRLLVPA